MTTFATLRRHRLASRAIGWLLMASMSVHGAFAAAAGIAGPLHTHRATEATLGLEDVRRVPTPVREREVHIATAFGHFHAGGSARRHIHAIGDGSVVFVDDGGIGQAQGGDGGGLDAGVATMDGLVPTSVAWTIPTVTQARPLHTAWSWLTFEPEPFERPPRSS